MLEVSDTVTVMRAGRTVGRLARGEATESGLAQLMVGRDVALRVERARATHTPVVCRLDAVHVAGSRGAEALAGIDLTLRGGEILGVAAVEGNGQAELLETLAGLRLVQSGRIVLGTDEITATQVGERRARGIASIPEDRIAVGLAGGASVAENLVATRLDDRRFVRRGLLDRVAITAAAGQAIDRYAIQASGPAAAVGTLSGGNMQKVVVARELAVQPRLLLVSQPTRGVDLAAVQFIWRSLAGARDEGAAVLLSSADLGELIALSDRLVVLSRGRIVAAFRDTDAVTPDTLGTYMLGMAEQPEAERRAALR